MLLYSVDYLPRVEIEIKPKKGNEVEYEVIPLADFIGVKSYKAKGKRLSNRNVLSVKLIDPLPYEPPEKVGSDSEEVDDEEDLNETSSVEASVDRGEDLKAEEKAKEKQKEKKPDKPEDPKKGKDNSKGRDQMELEF
jgi:hypothetical protein